MKVNDRLDLKNEEKVLNDMCPYCNIGLVKEITHRTTDALGTRKIEKWFCKNGHKFEKSTIS